MTLAGAALLWIVADVVEWSGSPTPASRQAAIAHVVHMVADALFVVAIWTLARVQRPNRQRGEVIETLLVLLGVTVPLWLLWVRPSVARTVDVTAGGPVTVAVHLVILLVLTACVVWYLVGDVWIDRQGEALRAALVVMLLIDLGPPFPGGGDPGPFLALMEVLRLALAVGLAVVAVRSPAIATPRPVGRRHWQPDRLRLVTWAAVTLVGPIALVGGVMAGTQDLHVIVVAIGATVVGIVLLSVREWTLLQDVGHLAGRQLRRAERHATLSRRAAALDDARTAFLRAASHDLRTPLMAVRGAAELLAMRDEELDAPKRRMLLATLNRNAERLEQMLVALLDVERLTAGTVEARHEIVDVGEVARIVAGLPHLRDEPIEVRPAHLPVEVDRLMVERIIENLVSNAVRHTPPGTPVWVDLERRDDRGLHLTITDAGPGIAPEDRSRVFEAFTRLDGPTEQGSGLGLSLVSRFAALHEGAVTVDERPGGGARFVVDLPGPPEGREANGAPEPQPQSTSPPEYPLPAQLGSRLDTAIATAVDDEQVVERAIRIMLHAETVEEVAGILERVVRYLGGVPVRLTQGEPLMPRGLDLALGLGPPIVPTAAPGSDARRRLTPLLPELVEDAHRIGSLLRGTATAGAAVPRELLDDPVALRDHFLDLAVRGRVATCVDLAIGLARSGEVALACDELLRPVQEESGRRWQTGEWTVADEHLVTGVVDEVIGALETEMTREGNGGRVVIVCPPDEWHTTPARLAALAWRCNGWQVRYLGIGVPVGALRSRLEEDAVDALAVSCTMSWHLPGVVGLTQLARDTGIPVIVGGAATGPSPDRARRVGATGWAPTALDAVPILESWRTTPPDPTAAVGLHPEAEELARRRLRVVDRVVAAVERAGGAPGVSSALLREDVEALVRSTEASLQVDDDRLLGEVVVWMRDVSAMRGMPDRWPGIAVEALVEAMPGDLTAARGHLAATLRRHPVPGGPAPGDRPGPRRSSE